MKRIISIWQGKVREAIINDSDPQNISTEIVIREREATIREVSLYKRGYGRYIKFDKFTN